MTAQELTQNELSALQAWMAQALRRRHDLARDPEAVALASRHFTGNDRLSPVEQLEIYREQFWLRHTSSLVEDFPGVGGIVGQEAWQRLVEEYLASYALKSRSLRDLGEDFAAFIAGCSWLEQRTLCADMARLEWAYVELFDAPDAPPLSADKLSQIPEQAWETARIVLNPALRLFTARYSVAELRRQLQGAAERVPLPEPRQTRLVLYRSRERALCDEAVGPAAFKILEQLQAGIPLLQACERVAETLPEARASIESNVGAWFQHWGERAWVIDVCVTG